jgi:hypothetical protein
MVSAAVAGRRAFGVDRGRRPAGRWETETVPPALRWFEAVRARGAQHTVVDPRVTFRAVAVGGKAPAH